ncbi:hypothetical protein MYFR107205_15935 [Mycolicibacterium frederiksbergense]
MAWSVAVASQRVPCGWYGIVSVLTFRPVTVQPCTTLPSTSSAWLPRWVVFTALWSSAIAIGALKAVIAPAAVMAAAANAAAMLVVFTVFHS